MNRLLSLGLAALGLCLFLAPQTAQAAPSLDWHGKDQITYQTADSAFGFDVVGSSMNHGRKAARNAGRALSGGVQLAIGIPVTVVGVSLLVPSLYLFAQGDILTVAGDEGGALVSRIGGVLLLSLALPALISGIQLIVGGATALSKIQAKRDLLREERYAMKSQRKARWGMTFAPAAAPLSR